MTRVFADTSYYLALLNRTDAWHAAATHFAQMQDLPTVTSAFVLTELADALADPVSRPRFLALYDRLVISPTTTIIPLGIPLFNLALDLYRSRPDKSWSLTDCTSFVVMQQHALTDALTADHHFEQAGFRALLK